ncbi:DUF1254 domain-containing protein [Cupriavidus alkaliphilus]|uniref:DUF1254 domain-containing protein n=1 Tax=Cupriavidus alkaliphilus TaxID=942866 RepID=UPI0021AD1057|nr:DUF1254 domain-containing protein [Cupriavidus alkaliphilus]
MDFPTRAIGAAVLAVSLLAGLSGCSSLPQAAGPATAAGAVSEQDIHDAYLYLLGRLLVLRQEQADFQKEGFRWNQIIHRDVGGVSWANPNLDVAYSEAWVAVDEKSCTIFSVPAIKGRYYTIQFLNGWGETVANINERNYPDHPSGEFAVCLKGASVALPRTARRIDLPGKTARVLARVEIGANKKQAVALQHRVTMRTTGTPTIAPVPATPAFSMTSCPARKPLTRQPLRSARSRTSIRAWTPCRPRSEPSVRRWPAGPPNARGWTRSSASRPCPRSSSRSRRRGLSRTAGTGQRPSASTAATTRPVPW